MRSDGTLTKWICENCPTFDPNNLEDLTSTATTSTSQPSELSFSDLALMIKDIKDDNTALSLSVSSIHYKLDVQNIQIRSLLDKIQFLEEKNNKLKSENTSLKLETDTLEQYSRRNCIKIHAVPEIQGENVISEVVKVGRTLGMDLDPKLIDNCHRLGKQNLDRGVRGIIVKFIRHFEKQEMLKLRKSKRNLNTTDLVFKEASNIILINENLTQHRRHLFSLARKMKITSGIMYVWTRNGNIYIRKNERSPITQIRSQEDLDAVKRKCKEEAQLIVNNNV